MWGRSGRPGRIQGSIKRKEIVGHTTDDRFSVLARVLARKKERARSGARAVGSGSALYRAQPVGAASCALLRTFEPLRACPPADPAHVERGKPGPGVHWLCRAFRDSLG